MAIRAAMSLAQGSWRGLRAVSSLLAVGLVAALVSGCGDGLTPEQRAHQKFVSQVKTQYRKTLQRMEPDKLVVTYEGSVTGLADRKRDEMNAALAVAGDLGVPVQHGRRSELFEPLKLGDPPQDFVSWKPSSQDLVDCADGLVIVLNLGVVDKLAMVRHPEAKEANIRVLVWNDPIDDQLRRRTSH